MHRARVFLETKTDQRDYDGAMREMEYSVKLPATGFEAAVLSPASTRWLR